MKQQGYKLIGSTRFNRSMLVRTVDASFISMTAPAYWAPITGTETAILGAAVLAAAGEETTSGTLASILNATTLSATGQETDSGTLVSTLGNATFVGVGIEIVSGTLSSTLGNAILAGVGDESTTGTLTSTLANVVLDSVGSILDTGTLASILDNAILTATGDSDSPTISGTLNTILANAVLTATGNSESPSTSGTLNTTLANTILYGNGKNPTYQPTMTGDVWSGLVDLVWNRVPWEEACQRAATYSFGGTYVRIVNVQLMNVNRTMIEAVARMPYDERPSWYSSVNSFGLSQMNWIQGLPQGGLRND